MKARYIAAIGMSSSEKNTCSARGENRERLIVRVPIAASAPITRYHIRIAASAMAAVGGDWWSVIHDRLRRCFTRYLTHRASAAATSPFGHSPTFLELKRLSAIC